MIRYYWIKYPWRSLSVVAGMIASGVFEGLGFAAVLPLLALLVEGGGEGDSELYQSFEQAFAKVGLPFEFDLVLIAIVVTLLMKSLISAGVSIFVDYSMLLVGRDNRAALIHALSAARWRYFTTQPSGVLTNLVSFEADRAAGSFGSIHRFTDAALRLVIFFVIGLSLSPIAMALGVILGLASLVVLQPLIRMARSAGSGETINLRSLVSDLTQTLFIFKPLKAMGSEGRFLNMIGALNRDLNQARRLAVVSKKILGLSQELMILALISGGLYVGFRIYEVPVSEMMFAALLLVRIHNQIGEIQKRYQSIANTQPVFAQMQATQQEIEGEKELWRGTKSVPADVTIVFENIHFDYDSHPVLKGVCVTIPSRRLTLITGPSGSGKTTIIDLLCGFHVPGDGRILVNNTNLNDLDIRAWRQAIGYLPQTPTLLNQSIRENVTYYNPDILHKDVEEALRMAGAWEFISELPEGIDTLVGERGSMFSGGQQQRIALARALVHKPRLLILDEPTASVDADTERLICNQLQKIKSDMTVVAISHQPALGRISDVVYQLEDGRISTDAAPATEAIAAT